MDPENPELIRRMTEAGAAWMVEYWRTDPFDDTRYYLREDWRRRAGTWAQTRLAALPEYLDTINTFEEGPARLAFVAGARAMGKLLGAPI